MHPDVFCLTSRSYDCDDYLASDVAHRWCRVSIRNVVDALRAFFRYGAEQGWCPPRMWEALHPPRIYALETLPAGPAWTDLQRLFTELDSSHPADIRARAIMMLIAVYGLRVSEVTRLRLDDIDWVARPVAHTASQATVSTQVYPLAPSVGNAICQYLQSVRRIHLSIAKYF